MAPTDKKQLRSHPPSVKTLRQISLRGCPVCLEAACEVLHSQSFILPEDHPLTTGYQVVSCDRCGFVYADTPVTQRDYDAFYARHSKYEDNHTSTGGGGSSEDAKRLQETAACVAKAFPDRDARLLDIGCANGGLLKALRDMKYTNLVGMDPSQACVEATRQLCQCEAFTGLLSSIPAGIGEFDGLILSHVLEHVQELGEAMSSIRKLLKPGAVAYLEVPDATRYAECLVAPFQDFNTEHINHFSSHILQQLCEHHELQMQSIGAKTFEAAPSMPYAAIYGFFTRDASAPKFTGWRKDLELRPKMGEYIAISLQMMDRIKTTLQTTLQAAPEIIIWGTGQLAMKLLSETCLGQAKIVAFVDGNPINHGKVLLGQPILAPDQIRHLSQPIVVTSILHASEISNVIRHQHNLTNPVLLLQSR